MSQKGLSEGPSRTARVAGKVFIVALLAVAAAIGGDRPPQGLVREIAEQGSLFEAEREQYTYRQSFKLWEIAKGVPVGHYMEVRDVTFGDDGSRSENFIKGPRNDLKRLRLTDEDFRDLREVNPFVLTSETLWLYTVKYKGTELLDGEVECFVFQVKPRQILEGQRFFDGLIWVGVDESQVVQVSGKPVPQLHRIEDSNLFPGFTTIYEPIDGKFWFPVKTLVNDVLPFPSGAQHVKHEIEYSNYQRFAAESTISFGDSVEGTAEQK